MRLLAMVQTPGGGGHGTSVRLPVAQNVSLRSLVGNQEELNGYDFIATHCGYGIINRIKKDHKKVILLRDPVERILSQYFYLRKLENDVSYSSHYAKKLSLKEFVCLENPAVQISISNTQMWHLIEDKNIFFRNKHLRKHEPELLDMAVSHLLTYDFVGFTGSLNSVLSEIFNIYRWGPLPTDLPHLGDSGRPSINEMESDTANAILSKVYLDSLLYNKAMELFGPMSAVKSGYKA
jgi:hypothetical protein